MRLPSHEFFAARERAKKRGERLFWTAIIAGAMATGGMFVYVLVNGGGMS